MQIDHFKIHDSTSMYPYIHLLNNLNTVIYHVSNYQYSFNLLLPTSMWKKWYMATSISTSQSYGVLLLSIGKSMVHKYVEGMIGSMDTWKAQITY